MTPQTLPATVVKNRFGYVLREVARSGGPIIVERDGKPVAVIMSMSEYKRTRPRPTPTADQKALIYQAFGMWAGRTDLADDWLEEGRARWYSEWADETER